MKKSLTLIFQEIILFSTQIKTMSTIVEMTNIMFLTKLIYQPTIRLLKSPQLLNLLLSWLKMEIFMFQTNSSNHLKLSTNQLYIKFPDKKYLMALKFLILVELIVLDTLLLNPVDRKSVV